MQVTQYCISRNAQWRQQRQVRFCKLSSHSFGCRRMAFYSYMYFIPCLFFSLPSAPLEKSLVAKAFLRPYLGLLRCSGCLICTYKGKTEFLVNIYNIILITYRDTRILWTLCAFFIAESPWNEKTDECAALICWKNNACVEIFISKRSVLKNIRLWDLRLFCTFICKYFSFSSVW